MEVINAGAIPIFVRLLDSTKGDVREQAVWALGNIAGDSPSSRDMVLDANAMPALLRQFTPDAPATMIQNATWTLSNLCRGKPPQPKFDQVKICLPKLNELIYSDDNQVLTDACWTLSYLSDSDSNQLEQVQAVVEAGCPARLIELLMHANNAVKIPALRTIGNIVTGDDIQTQVIVSNGALLKLLVLLNSERKGIRKEACWTISNITAGTEAQVEAVIQANIIPILIKMLITEEADIQKEACWALSNATSLANTAHIKTLVEQGCIKPFCDLLKPHGSGHKVAMVALEALENILKSGEEGRMANGGINVYAQKIEEAEGTYSIEDLANNQDGSDNSRNLSELASKILRTYFSSDDADDDLVAQVTEGGQQFSFGNPPMPPGPFGAPQQQHQGGGGFNFSGLQ